MFTGLVAGVGALARRTRSDGGWRLRVENAAGWETPLELGESIAVQGVCLTVARCEGSSFEADVLDETATRTTLAALVEGAPVNLERALRVGDRMGGHFVTGHIDGPGRVAAIARAGRDWILTVACEAERLAEMVPKGSIAIDGVSLTLAGLDEAAFSVCIIPHTWTHTSLSQLTVGGAVNLETDMVGKYVRRGLGVATAEPAAAVTLEGLRQAGFV